MTPWSLARPLLTFTRRTGGLPTVDLWTVLLLGIAAAAAFPFLVSRVSQGPVIQTVSWVPTLGVDLTLRLDGFSLLFALLITGIGALVALYAATYFAEKPRFQQAQFLLYIFLFMMAMLGAVTADNLIALFVFWEATSLLSYLLVGFNAYDPAARRAALQSLLVTAGGGLALLAGFILIGVVAGTFSITALLANPDPLLKSPLLPWIVALILVGAFTKSAQFPFHFWLPNAMEAPTPASAYLHSATMVKLGVYLLARFNPIFEQEAWIGTTLVAFGGATMLIAALSAIRQTEIKSVLALSTVASLGTLVLLIGLPGEVASVAVVGFILAHALYKAALFFCAGIVIHATNVKRLSHLGELRYTLPLTAAAAVLAGLSMAGLPPFIGFISKEFVFEANLKSPVTAIGIVIAVIVNSVMAAIAGVIALKPFFGKARRPVNVRHGEYLGMSLPPLILALVGVGFGAAPGLVGVILEPAANAIYGEAFPVKLKLWHGLTPMLALSMLVIALGAALLYYWNPIHVALRRRRMIERLLSDRGYWVVLNGSLAFAGWVTRKMQNGDMRHYGVIGAGFVTVMTAGAMISANGPLFAAPLESGPVRLYLVLICALIAVGSFVAAIARSILTATIAAGLAGYGLALIFLMNGAPDLALTQFSVETLFIVIMTAILLKLPLVEASSRTLNERRSDAALAGGFGAVFFVAALWIASKPFDAQLTTYFAETSVPEAFGRNVVNVILVDFRALDTFGEIAVVGFAALASWALLRSATARMQSNDGRR